MGWSIGWDENWKRDIGYGVPCECDHPKCTKKINRGLAYVCCDQEPHGGERGCGLYFCHDHQDAYGRCPKCARHDHRPYKPKPDIPEWNNWKLTDESWAQWRAENPAEVAKLSPHPQPGGA